MPEDDAVLIKVTPKTVGIDRKVTIRVGRSCRIKGVPSFRALKKCLLLQECLGKSLKIFQGSCCSPARIVRIRLVCLANQLTVCGVALDFLAFFDHIVIIRKIGQQSGVLHT